MLKEGADMVFNHHDPKYFDKLHKGEKFDVILEMLANVNLGNDLTLLKPRGRTIVSICLCNINLRSLICKEN